MKTTEKEGKQLWLVEQCDKHQKWTKMPNSADETF